MRYLLVDRIITFDPGSNITGVKNVAMSEDFLEFHFPKNPIMPGIMLLEALVQLSGWLDAVSSNFEKWFLLDRVLKCNFYSFVLPGDQVKLNVNVAPAPSNDLKIYSGSAEVNGKRKIKAEFQGNLVTLKLSRKLKSRKDFLKYLRVKFDCSIPATLLSPLSSTCVKGNVAFLNRFRLTGSREISQCRCKGGLSSLEWVWSRLWEPG